MRRLTFVLTIVTVLVFASIGTALADAGTPIGGCPDNFELHQMHEEGGGETHHHIGNDADQNGDGFLCMKHVGAAGANHVHIDNNVP